MNKINLVLPAAGLGSRFKDVGVNTPKPLIDVFGIPMILWVILNFPLLENDKVWVISQKKDELPLALSAYLSNFKFNVEFIEIEGLTEGPASTVALAFDRIPDSESLIVANTDQYVFDYLEKFVDSVRLGTHEGQILTMHAQSTAWSYIGRNEFGEIERVVEKEEISNEATVGIYGWSQSLFAKKAFEDTFRNNIRTNNEYYVAPTYNYMIANQQSIESVLVGEHGIAVHGLGVPTDLNEFLANSRAITKSKIFRQSLGFS